MFFQIIFRWYVIWRFEIPYDRSVATRDACGDYLSRSIVVIGSLCSLQRDNEHDTQRSIEAKGSTISRKLGLCRWLVVACCWQTRKHAQMRGHRAWLHVHASWETITAISFPTNVFLIVIPCYDNRATCFAFTKYRRALFIRIAILG